MSYRFSKMFAILVLKNTKNEYQNIDYRYRSQYWLILVWNCIIREVLGLCFDFVQKTQNYPISTPNAQNKFDISKYCISVIDISILQSYCLAILNIAKH